MQRPKVLIIVGPTASGKTSLAVELAKRFDGEVISADSRQVYRGLDIGTGKVTKKEMRGIAHHLLDVASPKRRLSADDFVRRAQRAISAIAKKGRLPIVAGGTGFYIDALVGRLALPDVPPNEKLRRELGQYIVSELLKQLRAKDPARARALSSSSERNNKVRIIRALEIVEALGKVPHTKVGPLYDVLWIGIAPTESLLEKKIVKRLRERIAAGMITEAKRLHKAGLSYRRMEELGLEYRSLARYLRGEVTKQEMELKLARDIRRYAKRQLTYWKRNSEIHWYKPTETKKISAAVTRWLKE